MAKKIPQEVIDTLKSFKTRDCKHKSKHEFVCDTCGGNFCDKCFGMNNCKDCEENP